MDVTSDGPDGLIYLRLYGNDLVIAQCVDQYSTLLWMQFAQARSSQSAPLWLIQKAKP